MNWTSPQKGRVAAVRWMSVPGLAILLAAAPAAADTVITAQESVPERTMDTLVGAVSPAGMAMKCREMNEALSESGRDDRTVAGLVREVSREREALRRLGLMPVKTCLSAMAGGSLGGLLCALIGIPVGLRIWAGGPNDNLLVLVPMVGCGVGGTIGAAIGVATDVADNRRILARHRNLINDLVRRVNRVLASPP